MCTSSDNFEHNKSQNTYFRKIFEEGLLNVKGTSTLNQIFLKNIALFSRYFLESDPVFPPQVTMGCIIKAGMNLCCLKSRCVSYPICGAATSA